MNSGNMCVHKRKVACVVRPLMQLLWVALVKFVACVRHAHHPSNAPQETIPFKYCSPQLKQQKNKRKAQMEKK
jgi:hypothetical protein